MVGVARHAEANDLGDRFRAARQCPVQRFDDQHGRALAQNHAVAVARERTAHGWRNDAHGFPGLENPIAERRFAAACQHEIANSGTHHRKGLADGVGGRRARGGNGESGPRDAEFKRDGAGAGVRHGLWNGHGMDAAFAHLVNVVEALILGISGPRRRTR